MSRLGKHAWKVAYGDAPDLPEMENSSRMRALGLPTCMGVRNWVK